MMSGLDIHYDLGEGHPLLGRRMPDLDLVTADGPLRVFSLLHEARPVLLNLGEPGAFDITPWAARVQLVDATYAGTWELPALGAVAAPTAVLIRPDGYVAWVGDGTQLGLADALTTWFGPPGLGQRRGGLPKVERLEAFGERRVDGAQLVDDGRPLGPGTAPTSRVSARSSGMRASIRRAAASPWRHATSASSTEPAPACRSPWRTSSSAMISAGDSGPPDHLDRRRHQRQSLDRPARLAARPGVDDEEHRPEDRRRDHPLVGRHPLAERGQPGVDLTDPDLRRTQQARPDRGPDPEVVLVGDLDAGGSPGRARAPARAATGGAGRSGTGRTPTCTGARADRTARSPRPHARPPDPGRPSVQSVNADVVRQATRGSLPRRDPIARSGLASNRPIAVSRCASPSRSRPVNASVEPTMRCPSINMSGSSSAAAIARIRSPISAALSNSERRTYRFASERRTE